MAKTVGTSKESTRGSKGAPQPQSLAVAERGIKTGSDFAQLMSILMSDLISGRATPQVGNAVCNAGGKLLKIVEMQHQYGTKRQDDKPDIVLSAGI